METIHDIDGNAEGKVRSLMTRVESLITEHPLPVVGAAFAVGAILGLVTGRGKKDRSVGGMVAAGIGAVAVRLVKSYALTRLGDAAKSWLLDPRNGEATMTTSGTESAASREPETESFLRH